MKSICTVLFICFSLSNEVLTHFFLFFFFSRAAPSFSRRTFFLFFSHYYSYSYSVEQLGFMLNVFSFVFLVLPLLCSFCAAQSSEKVIALSSDSASALAVGLFIVLMIAFGVKLMLGIEITDSIDEPTEK